MDSDASVFMSVQPREKKREEKASQGAGSRQHHVASGSRGAAGRGEGESDMAKQMAEVRAMQARQYEQGQQRKAGKADGTGGREQSADQVLKSLEEDLTCAICHELLARPVTLNNCGHSFCFLCLRTMVSNNIASNQIAACPTCRVKIKHPPTAPNHIMAKMVKTLLGARPSPEREELLEQLCDTEQRVDRVMETCKEGGDPWAYFAAQRPILDEDDGVWRCALCAWEIDEKGLCENAQCGKCWDLTEVRNPPRMLAHRGDVSGDEDGEDLEDGAEARNDEGHGSDGSDGSYDTSFIDDSEPEVLDSDSGPDSGEEARVDRRRRRAQSVTDAGKGQGNTGGKRAKTGGGKGGRQARYASEEEEEGGTRRRRGWGRQGKRRRRRRRRRRGGGGGGG
jgi:hypothetical protein